MITLENSLIKERLYIYVKVFHSTVAKTSTVGTLAGLLQGIVTAALKRSSTSLRGS